MSWESARKEINRLIRRHHMLFRMDKDDIDDGEWVNGRKILCFFPDPAVVPRKMRRKVRDKFATAVMALRVRPRFVQGDNSRKAVFPKTAQVSGFSELYGMSSWWFEVVTTASYSTTLQSLRAWRKDVAEWKESRKKPAVIPKAA